jgi:hypothetical protein
LGQTLRGLPESIVPLSGHSEWLLNEFGKIHGVGELYRKIV